MSTFEDQLWSQLVSDHGDQIRQAGDATASLAASLGETAARGHRWGSRSQPSRWSLAVAATTFGAACLVGAIIATIRPTHNATAPAISRAAFVVTDHHDGTVTVTLHKRSALPLLNATLARYGLKAKLPNYASARTLSLTATCPTAPKLPTKGHPLRLVPAGQHAPSRLPGTPPPAGRPLRFCALHTT